MGMTAQMIEVPGQAPDHEQKRAALGYLNAAWTEARVDGIDGDCLAQACLFAAFAEFVSTYGEEAAARFAEEQTPPKRMPFRRSSPRGSRCGHSPPIPCF